MLATTDVLPLPYGLIDAGMQRHRAAFFLLHAIWLLQGAALACSAIGLILLALMMFDADLANRALLGLLAADDAFNGRDLIHAVA